MKTLLLIPISIGTVSLLTLSSCSNREVRVEAKERTISVTGSSDATLTPDEVTLTIQIGEYYKEQYDPNIKPKDYKDLVKIAEIEIVELQNIPVTPPLFKQPVRTGARILKIVTDDGLIGISQIAGPMYSATAAFILKELAPFLKGQTPLETERVMHLMMWRFNNRAHARTWNSP